MIGPSHSMFYGLIRWHISIQSTVLSASIRGMVRALGEQIATCLLMNVSPYCLARQDLCDWLSIMEDPSNAADGRTIIHRIMHHLTPEIAKLAVFRIRVRP